MPGWMLASGKVPLTTSYLEKIYQGNKISTELLEKLEESVISMPIFPKGSDIWIDSLSPETYEEEGHLMSS